MSFSLVAHLVDGTHVPRQIRSNRQRQLVNNLAHCVGKKTLTRSAPCNRVTGPRQVANPSAMVSTCYARGTEKSRACVEYPPASPPCPRTCSTANPTQAPRTFKSRANVLPRAHRETFETLIDRARRAHLLRNVLRPCFNQCCSRPYCTERIP